MDDNYSTTSINKCLMIQMYQDFSEDQMKLDWNTFSFESELSSSEDFCLQYFKKYRLLSEDVGIIKSEEVEKKRLDLIRGSDVRDNSRNKLAAFKNSQENYRQILSEIDTVKNDLKKIIETNEILKSKNHDLEKTLENLKSEESSVSSGYKQDKVSYQKAINFYKTHADLDIDIKDKSNNLVKGVVEFVSVKHETPILVSVDKVHKKIIDFSCSELSSGDVNGETTTCLANTPEIICSLREHFIKSNKK